MWKRSFAILALVLIPVGVSAETTGPPDAPGGTSLQQQSTGSSPAGGSNADATSLQPAGNNPLQSTTNDATGLTAPNSQALQAPTLSDEQLRVYMSGEADGAPQRPVEETEAPNWLSIVFGILLLGVGLTWLFMQRRRTTHADTSSHQSAAADAATDPATTEAAETTAEAPESASPPAAETTASDDEKAPSQPADDNAK